VSNSLSGPPARSGSPDGSPSGSWPTEPPGADWLNARLDRWLADHGTSLVQLRRHLHAHPELSGSEFATTRLLADRLAAAGLAPVLLPKRNGLICDVGPDHPPSDRIVAVRADIDALPLRDLKDVPYRSTVDGVSHACGHDVHATIVTALGGFLASVRDTLPGRVRLLLQPAEEILPCGSLEVIEAGGLAGVSEIYALHCDPKLPPGQVGLRVGPLTAAADNIVVTLAGPGGHPARPHLTVDIVDALGRLVTEVPAILTRRTDTRSGVLIVFGQLNAGGSPASIPTEGRIAGTVRVLDRDMWGKAPDLVTQIVRDVVAPTGAEVSVDYRRGRPPVVNDQRAVRTLTEAAVAGLGPDAVAETPQSMGGEDFSWYLERVPGALARLGVAQPGLDLDLHQGTFDVDERAIGVGLRLLAHTAVRALRG
jgi:amidohydrolase